MTGAAITKQRAAIRTARERIVMVDFCVPRCNKKESALQQNALEEKTIGRKFRQASPFILLSMINIIIQVEPRTLSTKRPNGDRQHYVDHIFKVHTSAPFSKVNKNGRRVRPKLLMTRLFCWSDAHQARKKFKQPR
jgi:hypothetical protein